MVATKKFKEADVDPEDTYFKGEEFKGKLVAKFRSAEAASKAMDAIVKSKAQVR